MQLDPLADSILAAGHASKNNIIDRINIVGSPEIVEFVRPKEFIMTTGYPFRENLEEFADLIPQLVDKQVAGMGIKVKRFIPNIPESLIKKANEYNFPIVEIPPTTAFSDIVRVAMEEVFYKESEHLITLYDRIQKFTIDLSQGQDLNKVIYKLEKLIGNPIIMYDHDGNIIAPLFYEVLDSVEMVKVTQDLESTAGNGLRSIKIREEEFQCYAIPLIGEEQQLLDHIPFIACIESNYELTEVDCLTIEKIGSMLSMELANRIARKNIEKKYLNQFIQDILLGHFTSINDVEMRTSSFGIDVRNKWFDVLILHSPEQAIRNLEECTYLIKNLTNTIKGEILATTLQGEYVFLVIEDSELALRRSVKIINSELERFYHYKKMGPSYFLCAGVPVNRLEDIVISYKRAQKVKEISDQYEYKERLISFNDLHIYRLLYLLPNNMEVNQYIDDLLGNLTEYENKGLTYIETLEVYFQSNRNIRVTAEKLFTHYNTVVYRMEKIASILGVELEDPEVCLELQIALKLRKMKGDSSPLLREQLGIEIKGEMVK
ncbi:PucR family transcriptional regulator [Halalkalibacter alkaliphilus]|uniref:PucR family transcriptional regulator ligand-binding domain-containing protein n=1 Tax=Halalkalibacter alkaliphilus TaxID=2917993 RepID=A0A9X2CQC9_9BACI|nr:PucR family transcriptional regulator [Halalkalibacter alkaliphilus]MCL7745676.1 PucR family transcriptional regulator ligand-binding domain-containing protein [Halalkalibacter alkaliphilus]